MDAIRGYGDTEFLASQETSEVHSKSVGWRGKGEEEREGEEAFQFNFSNRPSIIYFL